MEFTARMIADLIGGVVEGNENISVNTFAKIEEGFPGALSFLANPKYTHFIYQTQASVILVRSDFKADKPIKPTLIKVDDPYLSMSILMNEVNRILNPHPVGTEKPCFISQGVEIPEDVYIGAFAYISENVSLGAGVKIYPQTYLGKNVSIGEGTVIYAGAKIYSGTKIGKNCIIHSGAVIGADGFGFAPAGDGSYNKIPQLGVVVLGDNVEIGANTTIDRATMGATRIESGTKLDNLIQIAHNVTIGSDTVMAAQSGVAGSAHIGNNCVFAGQVGVAGHITIGNHVTVGAQSGIPNSLPDNSTWMGYPAVKGHDFAKRAALLRRLPDLFERVSRLEKKTNDEIQA